MRNKIQITKIAFLLCISLFSQIGLIGQAPKTAEKLLIKWAMTVDNGEGTEWPHGPIGNLHIRLYNPDVFCYGPQSYYPDGYASDLILQGPTQNEWDDGDYKEYLPYGYYLWDWDLDEVKVFIYESDKHYGTGLREHDPVFCYDIPETAFLNTDYIVRGGSYIANDDAIARAWQRKPGNMNMLLSMLQQEWPAEYTRIMNGGKFLKMYIGFKCIGVPTVQQTIAFEPGWNLVSFQVELPGQPLLSLLQPFLNSGKIDRVLDQEGNLISWLPLPSPAGQWTDSIGFINNAQGYSVHATQSCSTIVEGIRIDGPVEVPLKAGWNILGYCVQYPSLAKNVVQPLIDAGILYKVIDEDGNELKYIAGMWINTIGYFNPGKAYYVKVTEDAVLTIN